MGRATKRPASTNDASAAPPSKKATPALTPARKKAVTLQLAKATCEAQGIGVEELARRRKREELRTAVSKKKICPEKGINLTDEPFPFVAEVRHSRGWNRLFATPSPSDDDLVKEFYHNVPELTAGGHVKIRGKKVRLSASKINEHYGIILNSDDEFQRLLITGVAPSTLLGCIAQPNASFSTEGTQTIKHKDLTAEAKLWHNIVLARFMPTSNLSDCTRCESLLIYAIMTGVVIDVGKVILQAITEAATMKTGDLVFPSLITELCDSAKVPLVDMELRRPPKTMVDRWCIHLAPKKATETPGPSHPALLAPEASNRITTDIIQSSAAPSLSENEPEWFRTYRVANEARHRVLDARFRYYDNVFMLLANQQGIDIPSPPPSLFADSSDNPTA